MQQVFVSHAKEDQEAASSVCEMLEADGARCWLASRDATAGADRAAEVGDAIRNSDLVLLVFSASANASPDVLHEMETAVACQRPVLPVRVDDATPNVTLGRYLDLAAEPVAIASLGTLTGTETGPSGREEGARRRPSRRTWAIVGGAVLAVVAVGLGLGLGLTAAGHRAGWTELSPSGPLPAARAVQSMVYDPSTQKMIMFGGVTETGAIQSDTWVFDPGADAWHQASVGVWPYQRLGHSMVYDPSTRQLVVFGGFDDQDRFRADTWAYDPVAGIWDNLLPTGDEPPGRAFFTTVSDPSTGKIIMFGGLAGGIPQNLSGAQAMFLAKDRLNDTWAYDPTGNAWTELHPGGTVPTARAFQAMAYDPSTKKIIMFGGASDRAVFNDTYAYDPAANAWTKLEPAGTIPPGGLGYAMAYDSSIQKMILFGGGTPTALFNDTWAYDATANGWTNFELSGRVPPARMGASMAYDPATQRLILFGGLAEDSTSAFNDTWAFTP
jgi:N-acetylneuraminic acid mutarotase